MDRTERPVKCVVCGKQMYYVGDPRHVEEVSLRVESEHIISPTIYMHTKCWELLESMFVA